MTKFTTYIYTYIQRLAYAAIFLLIITSCSDDDSEPQGIRMPIVIAIPAEGVASRVLGDPGEPEQFLKPKNVYLYVYTVGADDVEGVQEIAITNINESNWILQGDMYVYSGSPSVRIPKGLVEGRIYAVAGTVSKGEIGLSPAPTTLEEIKNLTYDCNLVDGSREYMKHLYSTPVITEESHPQFNNGVIDVSDGLPKATVVCYHVGAKVDVKWNINPDDDQGRKLKSLSLPGLCYEDRYIFLPTQNTAFGETYEEFVISESDVTPATEYYGRCAVYIPQPHGGDLKVKITYKNDSSDDRTLQPSDYDPIFTSWYRVNMKVGY